MANTENIVSIEKLGKSYTIRHEGERQYNYVALRDVLADKLKSPLRWFGIGKNGANTDQSRETFWALRDVSFDLKQGEVIGIIGRNGAGKSTLLKLLSRITEPTEGRIRIGGRVSSLLEVGTGFHPELTGRENVYLNGAILGMTRSEIKRNFDAIVEFAEVERFLDTPVKRYSSGMYVRLAFAVAAHLEPEILIIDEVLAVGDAQFQKKCLDKMEAVGKEGRTVMFVSHNMPTVTRLCPRSILLDRGSVMLDGPSGEVVSTYLNSGLSTSAERVWPEMEKKTDAIVRFKWVRVYDDQSGEVCDNIDIRRPVRVEIAYHNNSNDSHPYANFHLLDGNGHCVLASGDFTNLDWRHKSRNFDGTVVSSCTIPGNFLAEGQFRLLVAMTTHNPNEVLCLERDAVSFMIVDNSEGDGARGEYAGPFPGIVRPMLQWSVGVE